MKDYYKILGVKKDASEEEIREHWVELMRKLHPDQRIEGKVEDERIKEINEAYQVLKHSSTRVEYDLKRAYDQRKRNSYLRRLSIPIAIFVVLVMIGTLYLRKSQMTLQANLPTRDRINQIDEMNQTNERNQKNPIDQTNLSRLPCSESERGEMRSLFHWDQIDQTDQTNLSREMRSLFHWDQRNQMNQRNVPNDPNDRNVLNVPHMAASTPERVSASSYQRLDASSHSRILASTPLIATEGEVKQFLANYVDRYTQKDLDGFLSLFSSKAVQNRKDGLERIRTIYASYFNESQEIQYQMEDTKIEIYQNGVEVKARYEINQILRQGGEKKVWKGNLRLVLVKENGALKILSLDYQPQKPL
jgi:curved DNA-binding protein CbpA